MTGKLRWIGLLGVVSISGSLGWAGNTPCPTSATVYSSIQTAGCEAVDLNFTNFNTLLGNSTGAPPAATPSGSNTDLAASGSSVTSPISLQYTAPTSGSPCGSGTTLWCIDTGGTQAACAPPNQSSQCYSSSLFGFGPAYTVTVDQSQAPAPAGDYYAISSVMLAVGDPVMTGAFVSPNGNGIGTADSRLLVNAFICTTGPNVGDCPTEVAEIEFEIINLGPSDGGIQTIEYTCNDPTCSSGEPGLTFSVPSPVTRLGIEFQVGGAWAGSGLVSMDSFSLAFNQDLETPEPSTAALLGATLLAMIAFLEIRKRA